jgi:uncharacterized membrane protein YccC
LPHHETFAELFFDLAHWEFEIVSGAIGGALMWLVSYFVWRRWLKKHWDHHLKRDKEAGL